MASRTLTHIAGTASTEELRQAIQARPNELDLEDSMRGTPIYFAANTGKFDNIRLLMEMGCTSINTPNRNGATPMHVAASRGNFKCVQVLFEFGGDIDILSKNKISQLHCLF